MSSKRTEAPNTTRSMMPAASGRSMMRSAVLSALADDLGGDAGALREILDSFRAHARSVVGPLAEAEVIVQDLYVQIETLSRQGGPDA